jgi:predicted CopG family antitoxin
MSTKSVRLDEDVYDRIAARKRDGETFSEAIERLTGGYTLLDYAEETEPFDVSNAEVEERTQLTSGEHLDA